MKPLTVLLSSLALATATLAARAALQEGMPPLVKPGPEHELLKHMAGTWDAEVQTQFSPKPEQGTMTTQLSMNGLWAVSDYDGTMMGGVFSGHDILGWDPSKKKYVSCWVDSMSTQLTLSEGSWDEATKTLTMVGLGPDPMTGQAMTNLTKITDADRHVFEMYAGKAEGEPMMTIRYTRKK